MTLARSQAYCLRCLAPRVFAEAGKDEVTNGNVKIVTGKCLSCGEAMVRILPASPYAVVPEAMPIPTRSTYSGEDRYSYGVGNYVAATGTQALHKVERIGSLLLKIKGSVDLAGQNTNGAARWGAILAAKASATHFDAIVETIMAEGMQLPVVMWSPEGDRDGTGDGWRIGNGHHRITACVLLGMEYMPVVVSLSGDYMRAEDSSDDEDRPIERNGERRIWSVIRDRLPLQGDRPECQGCAGGCECCHYASCPNGPEAAAKAPAEGTGTQAKAACKIAAQAAAGDAVYRLRQDRLDRARDQEVSARRLRDEAEALIARAFDYERNAQVLRVEAEAFGNLYLKAANITYGDGR